MRSETSLHTRFARCGAWLADRAIGVLVVFTALLAAAAYYGASASSHLPAGNFEVIDSESDRAVHEAEKRFGIGSADVLALYRHADGDVRDVMIATQILDLLEGVLEDEGVVGATTFYDTAQSTLVSRDGRQTLVIVSLGGSIGEKFRTYRRIEPILRQVEAPLDVAIGGQVAASLTAQELARADVTSAEIIALPIAGLLTLIFFRSAVAAFLPILIGGFALASCAALIRAGSLLMEIAVFSLNVSAFLGLGLAIDYSLLMVQRFREELRGGRTVREAVARTLDSAGRAVLVSGLAVMFSLAVLIGIPVPILRSVAVGGVLATATALVGALLLLPALLAALGPRIDLGAIGRGPDTSDRGPFWHRVGSLSMRHPIATALACSLVLAALATPVLRMHSVLPDARIFPKGSEVRSVDEALADPAQFDPGGASSIQIIARSEGPALEPENLRLLRAYAQRIAAVEGISGVRSPVDELDPDRLSQQELERVAASPRVAPRIARMIDGDVTLLVATGRHPWRSYEAGEVLEAVRALPHPGLQVEIGGPSARMIDLKNTLKAYGRVAAVFVVAWNFLILLFSFRSLVVPLKAVLMNVLSLGASYGLLVWVFQDGHFSRWLGFEALGGIDPTIPLVMFAVVFGLSMDYEVFLLSRIREEWLRTGDNRASVLFGLESTGRIITSAALILLVVIGAFASGELVYLKQIGIGIGAAIVLDVTLVRALLVPATMQLLGDWNWWLPRWGRPPDRER